MSIIDIKFVFVMNSNISQSLFNYCHNLFNIAKKKLKLTFEFQMFNRGSFVLLSDINRTDFYSLSLWRELFVDS